MTFLRSAMVLLALVTLPACVESPAPDASGREIYVQLCARCHGSDLGGGVGPALGAGTNASVQTDEYLFAAIHDGIGRMPSFSQTLSDAQIERVVSYLRQVQDGG